MVLLKREAPTFTVTPSTRMTMERCVMHGETCENPVTISYIQSPSVTFATCLFHKLPLF